MSCAIDECPGAIKARGLCAAHYHRLRRYGDPLGGGEPRLRSIEDRLLEHTNEPNEDGCTTWDGMVNNKGYGMVSIKGTKRGAHVVAYELAIGPVPEGLELDHLCRTPLCVNPEHLEPVTHAENQRRLGLAQTHCRRYRHPYTEANTYRDGTGRRRCRECARMSDRRRTQNRKVAA